MGWRAEGQQLGEMSTNFWAAWDRGLTHSLMVWRFLLAIRPSRTHGKHWFNRGLALQRSQISESNSKIKYMTHTLISRFKQITQTQFMSSSLITSAYKMSSGRSFSRSQFRSCYFSSLPCATTVECAPKKPEYTISTCAALQNVFLSLMYLVLNTYHRETNK